MNEHQVTEEYKKEDWLNSDESPCHKCSNQGSCTIVNGCEDWKTWFRHSVKKERELENQV